MNRHILFVEVKRAINWKLLIGVAGTIFCICFDSWNALLYTLKTGDGYVHYFFWNSALGGVCRKYFLPMFAAVPFAVSFCREYKQNMLPFIVSREGRKSYCLSKYIANAISGGLAIAIGTAVLLCFLQCRLPLIDVADPIYINPNKSDFFHIWLTVHNPLCYYVVEIINGFLIGVLYSSFALWISAFIPNVFVVAVSPYLASFVMVHTYRLLHVEDRYRLDQWMTGYSVFETSMKTMVYSGILVAVITFFLGMNFRWNVYRRIENELHQ